MSFWKAALAAAVAVPVIVAAAAADLEPAPADATGAVADANNSRSEDTSGVRASSATAQADAGEPGHDPAALEDRKICRTVAPIGTRFGKKYCLTKKEWDAMRRRSQDDVSDAQRRGSEYRTPD